MFSVKIHSRDLDRRLDAGFYNPEYLSAQRKVSGFMLETLDSLKEASSPIGYGVVKPRFHESSPTRMVRIQNFEDPFIDLQSAVCIDPEQMNEFRRSTCKQGDILVAIGGYPGRLGILPEFPEGITSVNINQHIVRLRIGDKVDSYYVAAFLMSDFGNKLLSRQVSGSVQAGINVEDFRQLTIPIVGGLAQKYIGEKVRQAERLRAWGNRRYQESLDLFTDAVTSYGYLPKSSESFVWARLDNRLDPAYYDPKYSFFDEEWFLNNSRKLQEFIADGAYGVLPDSNSYGSGDQRFIRATDIRQSNIDPTAFTWVPSDQVAVKAKIKTGDILLEIKGAIEACELAGISLDGAYVNGSIYRFTPKNIQPGYLAFYLRSFVKQLYCDRVSVNNIIAYLDSGSISALPVLRLAAELEDGIEQAFLSHLESTRYAFALIKAAKQLVEALIEGQLIEAELITAEKALQAGNDRLDRHILSRLNTDGIDGQGPALFSDLDELYLLLTQAEGD
jgi:type I restriction enzyme S subunit